MYLPSADLAGARGIEVKAPFLDPEFVEFALSIDPDLKVRSESKMRGKWILRRTFDGIVPERVAWRRKDPIEVGSGMGETLKQIVETKISDGEFETRKEECLETDGVAIRSKEQLYYYDLYKSMFGVPRSATERGELGGFPRFVASKKRWTRCPLCTSRVPKGFIYCYTCGYHQTHV